MKSVSPIIMTQGKDVPDAIGMARDAIGLMGIDMQDDGEPLPEASNITDVHVPAGGIVSLVDVDFDEYRRKNDLRVVKKNCTIPSWLNYEAERAGVNFSAILQVALKSELNIIWQVITIKEWLRVAHFCYAGGTFGHWKDDCLCGKKRTKVALFVLSERLMRKKIIIKTPAQTADSIVTAPNRLERKYGETFQRIFKSITFDNGSEFADCEG